MRPGCNPTCAQAATPRVSRLQPYMSRLQPYISRPSESYQAEMDATVRQSDLQTAEREERQRQQRQERGQALWRTAQVTIAQEQKVAGEQRRAEERAAVAWRRVQAQQRAGPQPAQQVMGLQAQQLQAQQQYMAQAQRERLHAELAQREQGGQRRAAEVDEAVGASDQTPPPPQPPPQHGAPPPPPPPPGEGVFRSLGVSAATPVAGLTSAGQRSFDLAAEMASPGISLAELRLERHRLQMQQQRQRASLAEQAGHAGPQPADLQRGHGEQHELHEQQQPLLAQQHEQQPLLAQQQPQQPPLAQQHEQQPPLAQQQQQQPLAQQQPQPPLAQQQPQQTLAQQGLARPSRLAAINATRMLMAMEGAVVRLGPRHQATVPPWTGGADASTADPPARRAPIISLYLLISPYISLYVRQHGAPPD